MRFLLIVDVLLLAAAAGDGGRRGGFEPLFDGRSLDGWEGDTKIFRVDDGAIVGGTLGERDRRATSSCARNADYGDFELRLKFKLLGKGANAGVQFRSRRIPNHHEVNGYQADLGDGWWGSLYDESRRNKMLAAADTGSGQARCSSATIGTTTRFAARDSGFSFGSTASKRSTTPSPTTRSSRPDSSACRSTAAPPSEAWYKDIRIKKL